MRIGNNQKIKGEIAAAIIRQLDVINTERLTYAALAKNIKRKFNINLTPHRIGCWWREYKKEEKRTQDKSQAMQILDCVDSSIGIKHVFQHTLVKCPYDNVNEILKKCCS